MSHEYICYVNANGQHTKVGNSLIQGKELVPANNYKLAT